ncbi:cytosine deaminase [Rhodococcus sp. 06-462-5]|uniref:amidohydrolase family protein n=1 Tax=Nocardiaceae TaxID=85025 RepID=UPI00050C1D15|nr:MULTISPECIES: amidohydrolase family protein [Rhodococcus]OZC74039.1 cytosine deaminase [Rhodococcus sp. 06-462-5]OZE68035.1 cytosine deaminase [Rhodococcus sp. 02-925g]OZF51943.1 cytosine deaminase [Rhodococcus sp. 14-1411-2a]
MTTPTSSAIPEGRILIRGAHLLTQDDALGDFVGDVLIDGGKIVEVGTDLDAAGATVIDGTDRAVLPGFVDTHRHTWQGAIRQVGTGWDFPKYRQHIQLTWGPEFTPDDVYIGNLTGALGALDAGITTLRDESHIQNSTQHTDAAIAALRDSGIRGVFAFGWPSIDSNKWMLRGEATHPEDIRRVRSDVLADDDALVTLQAMLRGPELSTLDVTSKDLAMARELGIRSSMHVGNGPWGPEFRGIGSLGDAGLLAEDLLFIHCCTSDDDELKMLADSGAHASVSAAVEAVLPGLGAPATGRLLAAGIRPSLSIDTEASVAGDMFNVMRAALTAQNVGISIDPDTYGTLPAFTPADLLAMATIEGARASGLDHKSGSITPGKDADLIVIRLDDANLLPANDIAASIVGAGHPGNIDTVFVAGEVRKYGGRLVGCDIADIRARAEASRDRLFSFDLVEG